MDCNKCKKSLKDCECPDIDERMADLRNNPNFIYKMCATCGKHYERCKCEVPNWTTSHDGVSLEDALNQPTLGDKMVQRAKVEVDESMGKLLHKSLTEGLPDDAPEELKMAVGLLKRLGIEVHVLKGDPREIQRKIQDDSATSLLEQLDLEAYMKHGGKLN